MIRLFLESLQHPGQFPNVLQIGVNRYRQSEGIGSQKCCHYLGNTLKQAGKRPERPPCIIVAPGCIVDIAPASLLWEVFLQILAELAR